MIGKVWVEEYAFTATAFLGEINRILKSCFTYFLTIAIQLNYVALHLKLNLFIDVFLLISVNACLKSIFISSRYFFFL